jgi:hypothetical protein
MGFLDKVQQTAKETLEKSKEKLEDVQADRASDKLLRDLGAWYYATRTGRDDGTAAGHIERLVGELQAHEATHGELGKEKEPEAPAAPAAAADPFAAPAPEAAAPPAAPTPPVVQAPPPDPSAPVTDGPPPPPA